MSLTSLNVAGAANRGRVMPVLHPVERTPLLNGDAPVTITLLGRDSDAFIRADRAARNKAIENVTKRVKFSAAEQDQQAAETLARCTSDWSGVPQGWLDGSDDETPAVFSQAAAEKLYLNAGVSWVREQVDEFIGNRANFLQA